MRPRPTPRITEPDDHPEWAIRCDWCGTPAGQRCTTKRGRPLAIPSHDARITAWTTRQQAEADKTTESQETP